MTLYGLGNVIIDLTLRVDRIPEPGGDAIATQAGHLPGGSFNVLVAAARHGLATCYAGAHGSGPFGDQARAALGAAGIAVLQQPTPDRDTGFDVAITQADGERSFVTVFGAEAELSSAQLAAVRPVAGDFVHLSGYGLLPATNGAALADWVTTLNPAVCVLLDPGPLVAKIDPEVWRTVASRVTWFSCNRREAEILTGRTEPAEAARVLAETFGQVVVRDGEHGAWLADGDGRRLVPSIAVPVVDTNGAGDAHCGALLAALARGDSPAVAVRVANACAALAVGRYGPATAPTLAETLAALD